MKLVNSWRSIRKQKDKFELMFRISTVTIFELSIDISDKSTRFVLFNIGFQA
jgi:hypothetical protein